MSLRIPGGIVTRSMAMVRRLPKETIAKACGLEDATHQRGT
jgi:hypothetical protein